MNTILDYTQIIRNIIVPIVLKPNEVEVITEKDQEGLLIFIKVDEQDLGRVIGKAGKTAQAIRTLLYSISARDNLKLKIEFQAK